MNRDRHHAAFLPQEEVEHRKLYSEPPAEKKSGDDKPRDRRMIRRLWAGIGVLALIVAVLASVLLYMLVPRPGEELNLQFFAAKVDYNGRIIEEGQAALVGKFTHYGGSKSDEFLLESGQILTLEQETQRLFIMENQKEDRFLLNGAEMNIEISTDKDWCVIHRNGYYYICSTQEDFDPAAIAQMSGIIDPATASKIG